VIYQRYAIWLKLLLTLFLLQSPFTHAKAKTILVFGDSLSAAYNMPIEKGWVALLDQELADRGKIITIVNASISGETSSGGLTRFNQTLATSHPDILILELGANDGLRGSSLKQMQYNLSKMIKLSLAANIKVLLTGMHIPPNYGRVYTQKFDQAFEKLGQNENIVYMPFLLIDVASKPLLVQKDGLHPNQQAQPIILQNLLPFLLPLLNDQ